MKMRTDAAGLLVAASLCAAAHAASTVSPGSRDALVASDGLHGLTLGMDFISIRRDVTDPAGRLAPLETQAYGAFAGWQATPWLMAYGILGNADTEIGLDDVGDDFFWAAGLHVNLWRYDATDPEFLSGRWSVRAACEYASANLPRGEWSDITASLRLHWEIFAESIESRERVPYSLGLYAGPMISFLDAETEPGSFREKFEGDKEWGVAFGVEINPSHNTTIAMGLESMEDLSWTLSARYTF